jgi:BMFP domain-containing protein YqiC
VTGEELEVLKLQNATSRSGHAELSQNLAELEARLDSHDEDIAELIQAIRQLMAPPEASDRYIGFWSG